MRQWIFTILFSMYLEVHCICFRGAVVSARCLPVCKYIEKFLSKIVSYHCM